MNGERPMTLLGVFSSVDRLQAALESLKAAEFKALSVYSPIPLPEADALLAPGKSPVRFFTLAGAVLGCVSGFWLTLWTSRQWNLITGGKPIASIPPYVLIAFELTILLGTLATLLGVLLFARLPTRRSRITYDPRFSADRFGVVISCPPSQSTRAGEILRSSGAEEVQVKK